MKKTNLKEAPKKEVRTKPKEVLSKEGRTLERTQGPQDTVAP